MKGSKQVPNDVELNLDDEFLTPEELAILFKISPKTAYLMASEGDIPTHKIRSCIRFRKDDVADYIFFSKFHAGFLKLSAVNEEQLIARYEEQLAFTRNYIEKFFQRLHEKQGRRMN